MYAFLNGPASICFLFVFPEFNQGVNNTIDNTYVGYFSVFLKCQRVIIFHISYDQCPTQVAKNI